MSVKEELVPLSIVIIAHFQHFSLRGATVETTHSPQREILDYVLWKSILGATHVYDTDAFAELHFYELLNPRVRMKVMFSG